MGQKQYFKLVRSEKEVNASKGEGEEGQNPEIKEHINPTRVSITLGGFKRPEIPKPLNEFAENCKNLKQNILKGLINKIKGDV